jgi:hypothetical protein
MLVIDVERDIIFNHILDLLIFSGVSCGAALFVVDFGELLHDLSDFGVSVVENIIYFVADGLHIFELGLLRHNFVVVIRHFRVGFPEFSQVFSALTQLAIFVVDDVGDLFDNL